MSNTESAKKDTSGATPPTSVPSSVTVKTEMVVTPITKTPLANDGAGEETVKHFNNEYRLTKTGMGMTLLERVERLESQMESQNYLHCLSKKEAKNQKKRLLDFQEESRDEVKDAKCIADYMNSIMNSKLDVKIEKLQDYTEMAVEKLNKKAKIMDASIEKCLESCTETLDVIKDEERGRSVALDKLIKDSKEKSC